MPSPMRRANHNLSHYRLATFDMGELVPVCCVEVLMGDTFVHSSAVMLRAATLVTPVMHPVDVRLHHWFCPNHILWEDWDDFLTGKNPALTVPTLDSDSSWTTLWDNLGVPDGSGSVNALPVRAYNKIWNEFYRDQDIQTELNEETNVTMQRVNWSKDYFTTSRPTPQQGTAISIPFAAGTNAPVRGIKFGVSNSVAANAPENIIGVDSAEDALSGAGGPHLTVSAATGNSYWKFPNTGAPSSSNRPQIFADMSDASGGINVNEFRMAMALQRHLEARNRWGSRIQDYYAYHGVKPRDGRLHLPEYLGGGRATIAFSEVLATAEGTSTNVGDQAGHGIVSVRTRNYGHFFSEPGWVLSLMSVRPRTIYADQLHRQWIRSDKDDYWQKEYESFGPQAVVTKEVYGPHGNATDVFGYQGRHDEYRRHPSYVSGGFRGIDDDWHMARFFSSAPALNTTFLSCLPTDRIYADVSEPECRAMVSHNIRAKRLVSKRARY